MTRFSIGKTRSAFWKAFALTAGSSLFALGYASAQNLTPTPSEPSSAAATSSAPVERVVVTGSNIARNADEVPPTPVVTIDRQGIDNSGRATISEILQRLPINTGGLSETFTNGFAPGSSGLNLRGLGQNSTLTILNGRRVAPYALPQNATSAFTDLNSIPQGAVERIEILKDGASAIYGADAIAGVVNVILRDDFEGVELTSRYGNTTHSDGSELLEQAVVGVKTEKGSLLLTADWFKRNERRLKDRVETSSADQVGNPALSTDPNYQFYTYPGGGANSGPDTLPHGTPYAIDNRSSRSFPGRFTIPGLGTVSTIPGRAGDSVDDFQAGYQPFNFNKFITDDPETERLGFFAKGKYEITPWLEGYTELLYQNVKTKFQAAPTPIESNAQEGLLIAADNPYNPFGIPIGFGAGNGTGFRYRGLDFGPRINHIENDAYRILGGARVKLPMDIMLDTAVVYSQDRVTNTGTNFLSVPALRASLLSTDPNTALDVFHGTLGDNSKALLDSIRARTINNSKADLLLYDGKLTGPIPYAKLPAGPVMLAIGGEYRDEKLINESDTLSSNFLIAGNGGVSTVGRRDVRAGYYEVSIPVFSPTWNFPGAYALDLIVAQRYEDYSDFGNFSAPKFTIRYQPIKDVTFRASYSEGVRAPSLSELAGSAITFLTLTDPLGAGGGPDYQVNQGGNPNLQPEKSYAYYAGLVFSPSFVPGLSMSVDYSEIIRRRTITTFGAQYILNNIPGQVLRNPAGEIDRVNDFFVNLGETHVKTYDFDVNYNYDTHKYGTISLDVNGSYIASYKVISGLPVAPGDDKLVDYADTSAFGIALPDFKGQASIFYQLDFGTHEVPGTSGYSKDAKDGKSVVREGKDGKDKNPVMQTVGIPQSIKLGLTVNYVDSYGETVNDDADTHGVPYLNIDPGVKLRTVQSFTTLDTLAAYTIGFATFTLGVNNILDEKPPFVYGQDINSTSGYDFSEANNQGRFIYGEIKLKF